MRSSRTFLAALLAVTALMLQLTVVDRLRLPVGHPDLLVVVLICLALVEGPVLGMGVGFGAGLLADLLSDHVLGRLAFLLALTGYLVGLLRTDEERGATVPVAVVALGSLLVSLVNTAIGSAVGDPRPATAVVLKAAAALAGYDALLTPFAYPLVRGLLRRLDPERR